MNCHATRQQDEMFCHVCNKRWDADDDDPPECLVPGSAEAWVKGCHCSKNQTPPRINKHCPIHGI